MGRSRVTKGALLHELAGRVDELAERVDELERKLNPQPSLVEQFSEKIAAKKAAAAKRTAAKKAAAPAPAPKSDDK